MGVDERYASSQYPIPFSHCPLQLLRSRAVVCMMLDGAFIYVDIETKSDSEMTPSRLLLC